MPNTDLLSPWVRRFLLEYLVVERNLARNTQKSYRDTLRQFLPFVARSARRRLDRLQVEDLTLARTRAFLQDVEKTRGCGISTRNQRLAAIRSLARFIGLYSPEHLHWCGQIQTIRLKKAVRQPIAYLEKDELDALLSAPDRCTAQGRRVVGLQVGLPPGFEAHTPRGPGLCADIAARGPCGRASPPRRRRQGGLGA